jgi:CelD/BcsL family acetyltransferase involved in cellulose biosynthesis
MSHSNRDGVEVVTSLAGLAALAPGWDMLAESVALPMLTHAWVLSCAANLYREDALHVIAVRQQGVLAGVAPLVATFRRGIRRLELLGGRYLGEPSGLLYNSSEALDVLVRAIVDARRPFMLARIPAQSPAIAQLRSATRRRNLMAVRPAADTIAVPIASGWDEYLARLASRRRYDLKRARRRADQAGKIMFRIHSPDPEEVDGLFAEFVRIEAMGWKDRNGSSLRQRQVLRGFFQQYARLASRSGNLRFSFLELEGRPIAAQLSVEHAKRFWVLKIGYDEAWSRCSPGMQLLAETMRYAFEHQLEAYEFLGHYEDWLHGWQGEHSEFRTIACYPATLSGMWGLATDTTAWLGGRLMALPRRLSSSR